LDNPGTDSSPNNGIVRNLDTVRFDWDIAVNGDASLNTIITQTVSSGAYWSDFPNVCKTTGVTPVSSISQDGGVLKCNVGDLDAGALYKVSAIAKIRGSNPNNTIHTSFASITSSNIAQETTTPIFRVVSTALPRVEIEKMVTWDPYTVVEDPNTGKKGRVIKYDIGLYSKK
jgi:hypothetical protein